MSLFSISQSGDIFNRIGAIGDSANRSCRKFTTAKKHPRQPFWLPRASLLQVFVAGDDAAFEVDFDAIISDDDLFHQLLHDHAVICVHDCSALDVFREAVQPHLDLTVSVFCGLQFCLLRFQLLHPLTVLFDLRCVVCCSNAALLLGLMQLQHRVLQVDDLLLDALQRRSVFWLHDHPCAFFDRCHDFLCILDNISDRCRVGVLQRVFVHMVTVTLRSAIADPVGAAPRWHHQPAADPAHMSAEFVAAFSAYQQTAERVLAGVFAVADCRDLFILAALHLHTNHLEHFLIDDRGVGAFCVVHGRLTLGSS